MARRSRDGCGAVLGRTWYRPSSGPYGATFPQGKAGRPLGVVAVRKDGQSKIELITQKNRLKGGFPRKVVRVTGFEPAASCSQSRRATSCATPGYDYYYTGKERKMQQKFLEISPGLPKRPEAGIMGEKNRREDWLWNEKEDSVRRR